MSPQEKSLRVKAVTVGGCIEAATWLLPFWANRIWPEHPEDTLPMLLFGFTQFPGILAVFVCWPMLRVIGITDKVSGVISSAVTSVAQAFFFAVFAYILLYRPKKR